MRDIRKCVKTVSFLLMLAGTFSAASTQSAYAGSLNSYYEEAEVDRYVYDYADLLTDFEEKTLSELIEDARDEAALNISVLTIDDNNNYSQMNIADTFQDHWLSDYEDDFDQRSGVTLLIDMDDRQLYISTTGIAILTVNNNIIETILDDIEDRASAGEYMEVCQEFVGDVVYFSKTAEDTDSFKKIIKEWNTGNYVDYNELYRKMDSEIEAILAADYNYDRNSIVTGDEDDIYDVEDLYESSAKKGFRKRTFFSMFCNPFVDAAVGLVIALIFVLVKKNPKNPVTTVNAQTYRNGSDIQVRVRQDIFLRRTTTKRVIESSSGSGGGGGGGFHSSGGGRSHGGGGRGF